MEVVALGQLGQDVAQPMDRAALPIGLGPRFADGADEARRPVGHDEEGTAQAPSGEPSSEVEPVLEALTLAEADVEQDPLTVGGEAPRHQHALLGTLGADGQVDGVQEQRQETHLAEAAGAEGPVAVTELATDPAHGGAADRSEAGLGGEALDVTVRQAPHVGSDDEGLQGSGAG